MNKYLLIAGFLFGILFSWIFPFLNPLVNLSLYYFSSYSDSEFLGILPSNVQLDHMDDGYVAMARLGPANDNPDRQLQNRKKQSTDVEEKSMFYLLSY